MERVVFRSFRGRSRSCGEFASFAMQRPIYLDHHATTPVDPRVLEAMLPYFREKFGNAASINHLYGWEAAEGVATAREQVARLLNVAAEAIVFTSGATESNNLALKGVLRRYAPGKHLVTTAAEHKSVLDPAKKLRRMGYEATVLPVDQYGKVDPQQVADAMRPETVLVSVMSANNEVGTYSPIAEIGRFCRERGVLFHTDAAQSIGKSPIDLKATAVDLLSFSGHKIYGPKGVGVLCVCQESTPVKLEPLLDGGGHERRLRSGTLPVPLIVGLGVACEIASQEMQGEETRLRALRERLWCGLEEALPGIRLNGDPEGRLAGNLNVGFEGVDGDALMTELKGVAVSSGSACTSANPEPSHVLRAMGVPESLSRASLRFGLGRFTTEEEVDKALELVVAAVRRLRQLTLRQAAR